MHAGINIGHSQETIQEMRKLVLDVMNSDIATDSVKIAAFDYLKVGLAINNPCISHCTISEGGE